MHKISIQRGVSWEDAIALKAIHTGIADGFYMSIQGGYKKKPIVVLVFGIGNNIEGIHRFYCVTKPNTGRGSKHELLDDILMKFKKCSEAEAEPHWKEFYEGV